MLTQEIVSFITVLVVAVCVACSISVLYASGLRLWARADGDVGRELRLMTRLASAVCFAACALRAVAHDSDVPLTGRETEASYGEHSRWC